MSIGNRTAFAHAPIDGRAVTGFEPKGKAAGERRELFNQMEKVPWPAPAQGTTSHDLPIQAANLLFDHYNRPTIAG